MKLVFDQNIPVTQQWYFLACKKPKRNHKKRHRELRERKQFLAQKRNQLRTYLDKRAKARREFVVAVRKYWAGELEIHP